MNAHFTPPALDEDEAFDIAREIAADHFDEWVWSAPTITAVERRAETDFNDWCERRGYPVPAAHTLRLRDKATTHNRRVVTEKASAREREMQEYCA